MKRLGGGNIVLLLKSAERVVKKLQHGTAFLTPDKTFPSFLPLSVQVQCFQLQVLYPLPGFCRERLHAADKMRTGCTWPNDGEGLGFHPSSGKTGAGGDWDSGVCPPLCQDPAWHC